MKERLKSLITAAKIIQQLPDGNTRERDIKREAVDKLLQDIRNFMHNEEMDCTPPLPDMSLNLVTLTANIGRRRTFACTLAGDGGFEVSIKVIVIKSFTDIEVESNLAE